MLIPPSAQRDIAQREPTPIARADSDDSLSQATPHSSSVLGPLRQPSLLSPAVASSYTSSPGSLAGAELAAVTAGPAVPLSPGQRRARELLTLSADAIALERFGRLTPTQEAEEESKPESSDPLHERIEVREVDSAEEECEEEGDKLRRKPRIRGAVMTSSMKGRLSGLLASPFSSKRLSFSEQGDTERDSRSLFSSSYPPAASSSSSSLSTGRRYSQLVVTDDDTAGSLLGVPPILSYLDHRVPPSTEVPEALPGRRIPPSLRRGT